MKSAPNRFPEHPELTVVKLGGSLLEDTNLRSHALEAVAHHWIEGERMVVVHGGGRRIDAALAARRIPRRICGGLRVTDAATLEVVVSVLAGLVNKTLVAELHALGVLAAGLSGADGRTLGAVAHPPVEGTDLGLVGKVVSSDPVLVESILNAGILPVVASLAIGPDGTLRNVNADAAASALASAQGAARLVFLTDVEGVLDAGGHPLARIGESDARRILDADFIHGGMRPKLAAAIEALAAGVQRVVIAGPARHATVLRDGIGGTCLARA